MLAVLYVRDMYVWGQLRYLEELYDEVMMERGFNLGNICL